MVRMSEPTRIAGSTLIPSLHYHDAPAAIDWLCRVFGFSRNLVIENPDGTIAHAELTLGQGMVMLGSVKNTGLDAQYSVHPAELGGRQTGGIYLVVEDCDRVYAGIRAADAKVIQELHEPTTAARLSSVSTQRATSGPSAATIHGLTTPDLKSSPT